MLSGLSFMDRQVRGKEKRYYYCSVLSGFSNKIKISNLLVVFLFIYAVRSRLPFIFLPQIS